MPAFTSAWVQGAVFFVVYVGVAVATAAVRSGWGAAMDGLGVTLLIGAAGGVGFGLIVDRFGPDDDGDDGDRGGEGTQPPE